MKTLRYMLIVVALLSVMSIEAHMFDKQWGQKPVMEMRSTSAMAYSGSTLPQAAQTGVVITGTIPETLSPANIHHGNIKRIGGGNSGGGDGPTTPVDPWATPIGDVLWPMMLMAMAYVVYLTSRKKKENI